MKKIFLIVFIFLSFCLFIEPLPVNAVNIKYSYTYMNYKEEENYYKDKTFAYNSNNLLPYFKKQVYTYNEPDGKLFRFEFAPSSESVKQIVFDTASSLVGSYYWTYPLSKQYDFFCRIFVENYSNYVAVHISYVEDDTKTRVLNILNNSFTSYTQERKLFVRNTFHLPGSANTQNSTFTKINNGVSTTLLGSQFVSSWDILRQNSNKNKAYRVYNCSFEFSPNYLGNEYFSNNIIVVADSYFYGLTDTEPLNTNLVITDNYNNVDTYSGFSSSSSSLPTPYISLTTENNIKVYFKKLKLNFYATRWLYSDFSSYLGFNFHLGVNYSLFGDNVGSIFETDYVSYEDLKRTPENWFDIFTHMYNLIIYILFASPIISDFVKFVYIIISNFLMIFEFLFDNLAFGGGIIGTLFLGSIVLFILLRFIL